MSATETPDASGLVAALAARGIPCTVEARERLAILCPRGEWSAVADASERRALHQLATTFGFTHTALEVDAEADAETRASD